MHSALCHRRMSESLRMYACIFIRRCTIACILYAWMHWYVWVRMCVGLRYRGINHWSWAGGWCCCLHLSLSAGVRYSTPMIGRTEGGEKKWAMLVSSGMDRKLNAVVSKGSRQHVHHASMWRDLVGVEVSKPLVHIICISAGSVTHYLRSAAVRLTLQSSAEK